MLGDRYGRKKMLIASLLVFGAASIACAVAPSAGAFISARALLGLGGAMMLPIVLGLLPVLFDEQERARAIGAITAAAMLGYPIGPLLGGWMLTRFNWSWVFLINVPVVALALVAVSVLLPESRGSTRRPVDLGGMLLSAAGLALLTYGVIGVGDQGWSNEPALGEMLAGVLALAGFVLWERRVAAPLVDPRLFRSRAFTWGSGLSSIVSFVMFGLLFAVPLYFQVVRGANAQGSGIRLLPLIGGLLAGGAVADRLAARAGVRTTAALGFALLAGGLAVGATTSVTTGDTRAIAWIMLSGLGLGLVLPTTIDTALGAVSAETSSVSSGVLQALRMSGGAFGAAILGAIINATYRNQLEHATTPALARAARASAVTGVDAATTTHSLALLDAVRHAFVGGMSMTLWVSAGLMAAGAVLALAFQPREEAQQVRGGSIPRAERRTHPTARPHRRLGSLSTTDLSPADGPVRRRSDRLSLTQEER